MGDGLKAPPQPRSRRSFTLIPKKKALLLLAVLGTLGVLELSVLAMPASLPLWEAFLTVRGY